jgi:hypothetical protein
LRASTTGLTGAQGISEVRAAFEAIGWGPLENPSHDLGTDLYIQARDARRFDRGLLIGAQVKSGPSYFREPLRDEKDDVQGWWYREEDGDHFDYWITHSIPHLLVLHDFDLHRSYWAQVTGSAVQRTGTGNKIFVPAARTIDWPHLDELMTVASRQKAAPALEGTAWTPKAPDLAPGQRFRFALLAPRLVAPHRNSGYKRAIGAEEAVALVAQGRLRDLQAFGEQQTSVPEPSTEASRSPDWGWRFVGALWCWLVEHDSIALESVITTAPDPSRRTAAAIARVCVLVNEDGYEEAVALLDELINRDDAAPIDWSWQVVQRGRLRAELGDVDGARSDALAAAQALAGDADDVSGSAIAAAASWLLWQTLEWPSDKLDELVAASDTAISWWRSQTVASALTEGSERAFLAWVDDKTTRFIFEDTLVNGLFSATLGAHLSGEHGNWRALSGLLARHQLMSAHAEADVEKVAEALDDLRRSGESTALGKAARRVWLVGPLNALAEAVGRVSDKSWTTTTVGANFKLWEEAGDLLVTDQASDAAQFCLKALMAGGDEPPVLERIKPRLDVGSAALRALSGLLPASSDETTRMVVAFVVGVPENIDGLFATDLARVVKTFRAEALSFSECDALRDLAGRLRHTDLATCILGQLLAAGDPQAQAVLIERSREGDLAALSELHDVTMLDDDAVGSLLEIVEARVRMTISNARQAAYSKGVFDAGEALVVLNVVFPSVARWDALFDLLTEESVAPGDKRRPCQRLTALASRLPEDVSTRLVSVLDEIRVTPPAMPSLVSESRSVVGSVERLALALGAYDDDAALQRLTDLAMSGWEERRDLAYALGVGGPAVMQGTLAALAADPHADVHRAAGEAASRRLVMGIGGEVERAVVTRLAKSDGVLGADAVLSGLNSSVEPVDVSLGNLIGDLVQHHPSARIRSAAQDYQARVSRGHS